MGTFSIWHWLIVLALVVLLFGKGKISDLMGDVAKGIKNFKKGLNEDSDGSDTPSDAIGDGSGPAVASASKKDKQTVS